MKKKIIILYILSIVAVCIYAVALNVEVHIHNVKKMTKDCGICRKTAIVYDTIVYDKNGNQIPKEVCEDCRNRYEVKDIPVIELR